MEDELNCLFYEAAGGSVMTTKQYRHLDAFSFEPDTFRIVFNVKDIKLSQKECAVLELLCENATKVVDRAKMLEVIWGNSDNSDISLNKSILLLRRKFESMGFNGVIDTIPRVGYLLKLNMVVINSDSPIHHDEVTISEKDLTDDEIKNEAEKFSTGKFHWSSGAAVLVSVFAIIISYVIYYHFDEYHSDEFKNSHIAKIIEAPMENNGRLLLYSQDSEKNDIYESLMRNIDSNKNFYALLSGRLFTYINIEPNNIWQKSFFIDNKKSISAQIKCVANYLNNINTFPKVAADENAFKIENGMIYVHTEFYKSCLSSKTPDYIGDILISTTYPQDNEQKLTIIQNFTFKNAGRATVFNFKRISRVEQTDDNTKHLSVKSINVDVMNQGLLHQVPELSMIFNQFTADDIYQKHYVDTSGSIDNDHIFIGSPFGGILFYAKVKRA